MTEEEFNAFLDRVRNSKAKLVATSEVTPEFELSESFHMEIDLLNADQFKLFADALNDKLSVKRIRLWQPRAFNVDRAELARTKAILWSDLLANNKSLKDFKYNGNEMNLRMGDEGAACFARAMECNSTLESLSLVFQGITDTGLGYIATALTNKSTLAALDLSANNDITAEGHRNLANAILHNYKLTSLRISPPNSSQELTELADAVHQRNSSIEPTLRSYMYFCYANSRRQMISIYDDKATGEQEAKLVPALNSDLYKRIWKYIGKPNRLTLTTTAAIVRQYCLL